MVVTQMIQFQSEDEKLEGPAQLMCRTLTKFHSRRGGRGKRSLSVILGNLKD